MVDVGSSKARATWSPDVDARIGNDTTISAGQDVTLAAYNNFNEAGSEDTSRRARATAAATGPRQPAPDLTQGAKQGGTGTDQLSRADLARMTPQEIVAAQEAGRFNDLMAGRQ